MRKSVLALVVPFAAFACASSGPAALPQPARAPASPPVDAAFMDVTVEGTPLEVGDCEQITLAMVDGVAVAMGEVIRRGDVLVAAGKRTIHVKGQSAAAAGDVSKMRSGVGVVARVRPIDCAEVRSAPAPAVVRGNSVPELTWAKGAMHAHLDVRSDLSPSAYTGRLSGTAAVPEHVHESSWEIIALVEAHGTFVVNGNEQRIGPRSVIVVPPNTRHAWRPDPGSTMDAVQFYAPPGPEMRFQVLSDKEAARLPSKGGP